MKALWAFATVGAFVGALAGVLVYRASTPVKQAAAYPHLDELPIDDAHAAAALSKYIQIDTSTPPGITREPQPGYIALLRDLYAEPLGLESQVFDHRVLLLRWRAPNARDLAPDESGALVLLGHADVVPVAPEERSSWKHPPFEGRIAEGYVWGRGALDNKASTVCVLEAIRALKRAGLEPRRDIVVLVVPDEEIGGELGAGLFVKRHRNALGPTWAVLDEGSFVLPDFVSGTRIAAIAVGEKRYVTLRLRTRGHAGHASLPGADSAPRRLARALAGIGPDMLPIRRPEILDRFLDSVSARMPFGRRLVLRNRWLFDPLVNAQLASKPTSNALIRDTAAVTVIRSGVKDNVVPAQAEALVNVRLLPSSDLSDVLTHVRARINDPEVLIEVLADHGPTPVASSAGPRWERLAGAIRTAIPGAVVAPMLSPGTLDGRFFARAGIAVYRFLPFTLDAGERARLHAVNERISIDNLRQAVRVYAHLMRYY